ncbi:unnamed protein product [Lasius platythorax]|uniref:Leucine-rich repeat-containing protein 23 n=1 Tax=Lasius platythorax TaxID=488582 RepID=A0AAV2NFK0_9HYME
MAEFIEEGSYVATSDEESETDEPRFGSALTCEEVINCLHRVGKSGWHDLACLKLNVSYKNLTDVSVIPSHFGHVRHVNVSGNKLTSEALRVLETMPHLEVLQADRNRLTSAELKPMNSLEKLTLNMNKLTYAGTSVISHESLKHLELNHNLISTVAFEAEKLPNLTLLELCDNALTTTAGICSSNLKELFLAGNQIEKIEQLRNLENLKILHLRNNKLANLDGFSNKCLNLNYINLRNNEISKISELTKLSCLQNLETLIILENPFLRKIEQEEEGRKYRRIVLMMLPRLKKIDKELVLDQERNEANELLQKMQNEGYGFTDFDLED